MGASRWDRVRNIEGAGRCLSRGSLVVSVASEPSRQLLAFVANEMLVAGLAGYLLVSRESRVVVEHAARANVLLGHGFWRVIDEGGQRPEVL